MSPKFFKLALLPVFSHTFPAGTIMLETPTADYWRKVIIYLYGVPPAGARLLDFTESFMGAPKTSLWVAM